MASRPGVPTELPSIMKDLTKEILKENPANIYEFAAEYFENLIRERDGYLNKNYERFTKLEKQSQMSKSLDVPKRRKSSKKRHNSTKELVPSTSINSLQIDNSIKMQIPDDDLNKNYNGVSSNVSREVNKIHGTLDKQLNDDVISSAATQIQSAYRGYTVRKNIPLKTNDSGVFDEDSVKQGQDEVDQIDQEMNANLDTGSMPFENDSLLDVNNENEGHNASPLEPESPDFDPLDFGEEEEAAAAKIQALYKGHMVIQKKIRVASNFKKTFLLDHPTLFILFISKKLLIYIIWYV